MRLPASRYLISVIVSCILSVWAGSTFAQPSPSPPCASDALHCEPYFVGRSLFLENDVLLPNALELNEDRNYTQGLVYTSTGRWVHQSILHIPLRLLNRALQINHLHELGAAEQRTQPLPGSLQSPRQLHTFEIGISAFTPDQLEVAEPIPTDRPYGSIAFIGTSRQTLIAPRVAVSSELKLGVLGLRLAETAQTWIHEVIRKDGCGRLDPSCGAVDPQGWPNQISDGGEVTGRFRLGLQYRLASHSGGTDPDRPSRYDVQGVVEPEIGYYTDLTGRIAGRVGRIHSPWWHFRPNPISETVKSFDRRRNGTGPLRFRNEWYLWASVGARLVGYNALLQGQFKKNIHELNASQIRRSLGEFQIGATVTRGRHSITYVIAGRSSEHRLPAQRNHLWGGIYYSYTALLERLRGR